MEKKVPNLVKNASTIKASKDAILAQWLSYESPRKILKQHDIDIKTFIDAYASGVFDYFMGVIAGEVEIGDCPIMRGFLDYLKDKEIKAEELFDLCSHFRRSIIDFTLRSTDIEILKYISVCYFHATIYFTTITISYYKCIVPIAKISDIFCICSITPRI